MDCILWARGCKSVVALYITDCVIRVVHVGCGLVDDRLWDRGCQGGCDLVNCGIEVVTKGVQFPRNVFLVFANEN